MRKVLGSVAAATLLTVAWTGDAVAQVSAKPDPKGLPGSPQAEHLINGLYFWTLLGILVGLLVSIIVYATASHFGNHHYSHSGKSGILTMAGLATVAGAAPAIVNFFVSVGDQIR